MKIGGLDIGTTGCKLTVFDENGTQLGKAYRDYPVRRALSGHEIDISTMMESVYEVIREMTSRYPDIRGIGVTSFGETFVMVDEAGTPLHNAMLYTDPRGAEECAEDYRPAAPRDVFHFQNHVDPEASSGNLRCCQADSSD